LPGFGILEFAAAPSDSGIVQPLIAEVKSDWLHPTVTVRFGRPVLWSKKKRPSKAPPERRNEVYT
jgi:hypothetical protein